MPSVAIKRHPRPPHGAVELEPGQAPLCPICCDSQLDDQELVDPFCACGFQLCSFCMNRIQTESDNTCPHCRTSYDEDPQAALREQFTQRQLQQPAPRPAAPHSPLKTKPRSLPLASNGHTVLEVPRRPAAQPTPPSPGRNLGMDQERQWPGLAAAVPAAAKPTPSPASRRQQPSLQTVPQQKPPPPAPEPAEPAPAAAAHQLPPLPAWGGRNGGSGGGPAVPETPPYGGAIGAGGWLDSSAASSVPTASGTPPSPADPVIVSYQGAVSGGGGPLSVHGDCVVLLRGGAAAAGATDPDGAALVDSLREGVRRGTISARQAAAAVVRHMRDRRTHQQQQQQQQYDHLQQQQQRWAAPVSQQPAPAAELWPSTSSSQSTHHEPQSLFSSWGVSSSAAHDAHQQQQGMGAFQAAPAASSLLLGNGLFSGGLGGVLGSLGGGGGGGGGGGSGAGALKGPPPGFASGGSMFLS